jgi:hypothetical protein
MLIVIAFVVRERKNVRRLREEEEREKGSEGGATNVQE